MSANAKKIAVVAAAVLAGVLYALFSGNEYSEVARSIATAVEEENVSAFMANVAPEGVDFLGLSREELALVLQVGFEKADQLEFAVAELQPLEETSTTATVRMRYRVSGHYGGKKQHFIGNPIRAEDLDLALVRGNRDRWLLKGARIPETASPQAQHMLNIIEYLKPKISR